MLYRMTVPVEGFLFLEPGALGCSHSSGASDLSYALTADETGRVVSATIQAKVPPEKVSSFFSTFTPGHGDSKLTVSLGGDKELYERIVLAFRKLECNLSFALRGQALRRINCEQLKIEMLPETDEERARVGVTAYEVKRGYADTRWRISGPAFGEIVQNAPRYEEFDVHKAFLHDGMNQFHRLQYVAAFYQFYFVLEDFYAGGKTSEKDVVKAFASSDELTHILERAIQRFTKDDDRHTEMLQRFMTAEGCEITLGGMRKFLFRIRGHLHHYSSGSTKPKGTPFNQ
jgi:hypothetical protein